MSSVPKEIKNLPKEACHSFFFVFFLMLLNYIYYLHKSKYVQVSSLSWATGGSAEQPLQVPGGKVRSQPKPHPSSKIV